MKTDVTLTIRYPPYYALPCWASRRERIEIDQEEFETISEGELVEVIQGPLQGIIATSIEHQRNYRIIIQFESIGRQFVVHVPRSQVRKIKDKIA